jgi:glycosyltransferase involved in cell wall biosynthesis
MTLGGSLFVRDAVRLDYCLEAAIESLVGVCDEVVVMDCQSTDGTAAILRKAAAKWSNVTILWNSPWEVASGYVRLALLANAAREALKTDWHFMLQADEVLHESSYPAVLEAVRENGWGRSSFKVRRLNLWAEPGLCVRGDSKLKPCSDEPTRLGHQNIPAVGDGESLIDYRGPTYDLVDRVTIFHYGFLRRGLIDKVIEMESWFHGPGSTPDERVVAMKEQGGVFVPEAIIPDSELIEIPIDHPAPAKAWVADHPGRVR